MNETKVNLVASTLTNSLGTTVIGHVGVPAAVINVKYPNGKYDTVVSDNQGDFVTKAPAGVIDGKILVEAQLPGDVASKEAVTLTIDIPAPVVTAIISTQDNQRLLEGRVNQPDVDVTVKLNEEDDPVFLLVDNSHEFELVLPENTTPAQVEVIAKSRLTGKTATTKVGLGVTTKTLVMPALTDDMIAEYVAKEKEQQAAAQQATAEKTPRPFQPAAETAPVDIPEEVVDEAPATRQQEKPTGLRGFFSKLFGK